MKRSVRRSVLSLGLVIFLLFSIFPSSLFARETDFFNDYPHEDVHYRDMVYERYDSTAFYEAKNRIEELCLSLGNEIEIIELYEFMLSQTDRVSTLSALNNIRYHQNVFDEDIQSEDLIISSLRKDIYDDFYRTMSFILNSEHYSNIFAAYIGEGLSYHFYDYEGLSEEDKAFYEAENTLVQEYYVLANDDSIGNEKRHAEVAAVFMELLSLRHAFAVSNDYDNYASMESANSYARDYDLEQMQTLFDNVKKYVVPLYNEIVYEYAGEKYMQVYTVQSSMKKDPIEFVGKYIEEISSEYKEAWDYMVRNELYDLEQSDTKSGSSFMIGLPQWNSGYIFETPYRDYFDVSTLIHEFGHFAQEYFDSSINAFSSSVYDLFEVHSQGHEMLFSHFYEDMYGEDADAFLFKLVYEMLSPIITYSYIAELEVAIYSSPDITIEEIDALSKKLIAEYGEDPNESFYDWTTFTHLVTVPMYSVSYVVSGLVSFDIWMQSLVDWEFGVDTYLTLSGLHCSMYFQNALAYSGCSDIFDTDSLSLLCDNIMNVMIYDKAPEGVVLERPDPSWFFSSNTNLRMRGALYRDDKGIPYENNMSASRLSSSFDISALIGFGVVVLFSLVFIVGTCFFVFLIRRSLKKKS